MPNGINNIGPDYLHNNYEGQIAGSSASCCTGFLYSNGSVIKTFNHGAITIATDVNNQGQVVGSYSNNGGFTYQGFLDNNTSISIPGKLQTLPTGVNDNAQIVGYYTDSPGATGTRHGFLWHPPLPWQPIDYPAALQTFPRAINGVGQIVGHYENAQGKFRGFLAEPPYGSTDFTSIKCQGPANTFLHGSNNNGQIVGICDISGSFSGFLLDNNKNKDKFTFINYPGATSTFLSGINDDARMVGDHLTSGSFDGFTVSHTH